MMYRNTFKILLSNFHLVWKILGYLIFSTLVVVGLAYASSLKIVNVLSTEGVLQQFSDLFTNFSNNFNIYELLRDLLVATESFANVIALNINALWFNIVLFLVVIVLVRAFVVNFYQLAATNCLYYQCSSNIKIGFTASLLTSLKANLKYSLVYLITILPIDILIGVGLYYLASALISSLSIAILTPLILMLVFGIVMALRITLFSGWIPAIIVLDLGVFKALKVGIKSVFKRFYRTYSTALFVIITLIILIFSIGVVTFGAGLLLAIPLAGLALLCFNLLMFYLSQGMKFYVDSNTIVTPKKAEELDKINKQKLII